MLSPIREAAYQNMQLDAGIFLANFNWAQYADAPSLAAAVQSEITTGTNILGVSIGGGTFAVTPTFREIEADGKRNAFVGSRILDGVDVHLTSTLKEITPDNWVRALATAKKTVSGAKTTIKMRNKVRNSDYIPRLCWIGEAANGQLILIGLTNALSLNGATLTFTDKGEGSIPVDFSAHQAGIATADYAPFEIIYFDDAAIAQLLTIVSVAGTSAGKTALLVLPQKTSAQSYKYKLGVGELPAGGEVLTTGWVAWDGSAEITATNGDTITVAIVTTADNKCVYAGTAQIVSA